MIYNRAKFAARLRELMDDNELTVYTMAEIAHLSAGTISRYTNQKLDPKRTAIEVMANHFKVNPVWLMGGDMGKYENVDGTPETPPKLLPLLGTIACGSPILAAENIESYVATDHDDKATFCLTAKGDSMIGIRITSGDILFVREQSTVENGDVAAVIIDGQGDCEATVKRFYRYGDTVVLRPENSECEELTFKKSEINRLRIIGKVIAFRSEVR